MSKDVELILDFYYFMRFYSIWISVSKASYFTLLQGDDISRVSTAAKIVERMVNQNTFDDIAQGKLFNWNRTHIPCI